jgi:hypothetical protein
MEQGNINSLNPYDIESIQVLKDAAAYSIMVFRRQWCDIGDYKKGKGGKAKLSYDFYIGATRPLATDWILNPRTSR